jgi:preprotein translocase subunit SecE
MEEAKKAAVSQPETKKEGKSSFNRYFKELKGEFKKIIWPGKKELGRETVTVIVLSLLVGVIIFAIDQIFNLGYGWFVTFVQGLLK